MSSGRLESHARGRSHGSEKPEDSALEPATPEESLPRAEYDCVIRLGRWALLQNKVRGAMFDRVIAILERLQVEGTLRPEDRSALDLLASLAENEGFDPDKDVF